MQPLLIVGVVLGIALAVMPSRQDALMPDEEKRKLWAKKQWKKKYLHPIYNTLFFGSIVVGALFWIGNH